MPSPPLDGRVLITGASSGIGEALALQLASRSSGLILVARRTERLNALAQRISRPGLEVVVVSADLAKAADRARVLEQAGPVDVLVNNAGLGDISLFEASDADKNAAMTTLNCIAVVELTHGVLPGMIERGRGGVLNISSGFGLTFMPATAVYIGTKHFVSGFTESLRAEVRSLGIVVTQSCPGPVATEFEANAGNPTGMDVPSFIEMDADAVARQSLAGFERDQAIVVPGWTAWLLITLGRLTPRPITRMFISPLAGWLRTRTA